MSVSTYLFNADPRARLQAAEELLDDGSIRLLSHLGAAPGRRCLEVGAGGGSIARWLAGAGAHVVATDLDTRALEGLAGPNLEVRQHDVVRDAIEEQAFDLIHARLLLEHLPEREAVLDKLVAALAPGGWLAIEDVDYAAGVPVSEFGAAEHERVQSVRLREFAKLGVDPYFGRRLPERLRVHGLTDVANEGRVWVMEGGSAGARWLELSLHHLRGRLVGEGKLTDAEVDAVLPFFRDPRWAAFSPIIMAVWGRKGAP
jgi:SAM-dependent methyltransferase